MWTFCLITQFVSQTKMAVSEGLKASICSHWLYQMTIGKGGSQVG